MPPVGRNVIARRTVVRAGLAAAGTGLLAGCTSGADLPAGLVLPTDPSVSLAEARRPASGVVRAYPVSAQVDTVDLGGPAVTTWTYGGQLPGRELRVRVGDTVEAVLANRLPVETSIHWHGLALRNDMDGAPMLTQPAVPPGGTFTYRFVAATPGTHWLHPHSGTQLDRGLYAPLIVEDPAEPGDYDQDWLVLLDDWVDGTGRTPDDVLADLRAGGDHMAGMSRAAGRGGDVDYPYYLINGRIAEAPVGWTGTPGQRARIRLVNAASDTAFRVAIGGHRLRVTHTDGFPVRPVDADALLIGMGERYDVMITLADGVFPLVALAEGKAGGALGLIRTGAGEPPLTTVRPAELDGALTGYPSLVAESRVRLPARTPDVEHRLDLTGGMMGYRWGINGAPLDMSQRLPVRQGQRMRIVFTNHTMMWHPMHVHGHTFQLGNSGPRKDTVIVLPGRKVACDLDADNPGQWMIHCHNTYHSEAGMATVLGYRS
ncbi:MAG TPA: multicopper oxidase family protein [Actinophytocola sp.]|uniref:multicopper oxidase family protein n=1 Tax=Actinophytocola sp. TaxID=1872138 RepID=UPI002DBAC155|nr:multicopper oxidase family protein [Actinophytocola sp.]HEU5469331.1 multicopper oxidase family protein [Actinophytocola sp.]